MFFLQTFPAHLKLVATVVQHFHLAMLAGRARVLTCTKASLDMATVDGRFAGSQTPAIALTFPTPAALAMSGTFLGGMLN